MRRAVAITPHLLLALLVVACAPASVSAGAVGATSVLFEPPWRWTDEQGTAVTFSQWRGDPIVVTAIFTSCTTRCPLTIEKLEKLDAALRKKGKRAQFALVTIDPQNDDPARLLRFKQSHHLPESWHMLRGGIEQTRDLCRMLGVHAIVDDSHIDHNVRIAIVDSTGQIVRNFAGWDFDEDRAAEGT